MTLTEDTDWSEYESVSLSTTIDLGGHVLTLSKLTANSGAAFSGGDGSAVTFRVPDGGQESGIEEAAYISGIENLTLSGSAKIVLNIGKDAGAIYSVKRNSPGYYRYTEVVQEGGQLSLDSGNSNLMDLEIARNAHGVYRMSGGSITTGSSSEFRVGTFSKGEFIQTGGDVTVGKWISIARREDSSGTYTITGGTLTALNSAAQMWVAPYNGTTATFNIGGDAAVNLYGLWLGGGLGDQSGTKTANANISGGTLKVGGGNFLVGSVTGTKATLTQTGGRIEAKTIRKHAGTATVALDGGTIKATGSGKILDSIDNLSFGGGEVVFDTDYDTSITSSTVTDTDFTGTFAKDGSGKLTIGALPCSKSVEVRGGTLAVTAATDNSGIPTLAHRWSFDEDLTDSITGKNIGKMNGSGYSFADGVLSLQGGSKGTCYADLGANMLPADSVTIEMWMTMRSLVNWTRGFAIANSQSSAEVMFVARREDNGNCCNFQIGDTRSIATGVTLSKDTQYYVAVVLDSDGENTTVRQYVKAVGSDDFLYTNTFTTTGWTVSGNVTQPAFWLGHSNGNDPDINADYDEVRVWNGALTASQIAASSAASCDAELDNLGTLAISSGATIDLGATTLKVPRLSGAGAVTNGTLIVAGSVVAESGSVVSVKDGATLDLTEAEVEFSGEVPSGGFTLARADGGTITAAEPRKIDGTNLWLYLTSEKALIGKPGLIIVIK